ncbi:MAG TPA: DUF29 domain-containing protein [Oscillatoriales cyanobacterium M59_W2019_021]|nr:DUF29 domain-containing protein [Oscillatoriales cyanobacterium M4454_W2019_049]HIK49618.1 DUF29 domain-containing protein [Oscillatoriales cyanobacterium M59_W2019_021]
METQLTPASSLSHLYDRDYYLWLNQTAKLVREHRLSELDIPHLVEELEDMGRSEKRAVESNLVVVLMHLLKYQYQPQKRSNSWKVTIREHRRRLRKLFQNSPSLKPYFEEVFLECYQDAREQACDETGLPRETFPTESPFTPEEAIDRDYLPNGDDETSDDW